MNGLQTKTKISSELMTDWWDADLEPDKFRRLGYQAIDMMADYFASIRDRPVFPGKSSQVVADVFNDPLPLTGQSADQILSDWPSRVLPNATHLGSPRYFGFVNGSGTMLGVLAEALAASVNMNAGGWKAGPAATEIERRTIAWIAEMIEYPTGCGGLFTSGGTMANFTALLTALRNTAQYDLTCRRPAERDSQREISGLHGRSRRAYLDRAGGRPAQPGAPRRPASPEPERFHHGPRGA